MTPIERELLAIALYESSVRAGAAPKMPQDWQDWQDGADDITKRLTQKAAWLKLGHAGRQRWREAADEINVEIS